MKRREFSEPDSLSAQAERHFAAASSKKLCSLVLAGASAVCIIAAPVQLYAASAGWKQENGLWYYYENGTKLSSKWLKLNGSWYYLRKDGSMMTGWAADDAGTYYFNAEGVMSTGWKKVDGYWHYFRQDGTMVTGWLKDANAWYYFNDEGFMLTGKRSIDGTTYYFRPDGSMAAGSWVKIGSDYYYFEKSGAMKTNGWVKDGSSYYYVLASGAMAYDRWISSPDGSEKYYVDASGVWTKTQSAWKTALTNYINTNYKQFDNYTYALIHLDSDRIPEVLIERGGSSAGGQVLLSYWKGTVYEQALPLSGEYIPYGNVYSSLYAHQGYGQTNIYKLENGRMKQTAEGTTEENYNGHSIRIDYYWNGSPVSEADYTSRYDSLLPPAKRSSTWNLKKVSRQAILSQIENS